MFMKKYIQDNLLLTKEDMIRSIQRQREAQAAQYGLTLEQWEAAIVSGSVVESKPNHQ
jgi:hypothetical protein